MWLSNAVSSKYHSSLNLDFSYSAVPGLLLSKISAFRALGFSEIEEFGWEKLIEGNDVYMKYHKVKEKEKKRLHYSVCYFSFLHFSTLAP